jgi:lactoylglutathione lyase
MATYLKALVTIYSVDIRKAMDFYGRILGFAETYRFPKEGEPEHVEFQIGGATLAVSSPAGLRTHGMPLATPGHPFELGIKTDNVNTAVNELRAAGVMIIKEPSMSPAGNRYAYIVDPDGNWISLYQNVTS